MAVSITAIYERGVFRPLEKLDLPEHQKFQITIRPTPKETPAKAEPQTLADVLGFDPADTVKLLDLGRRQRQAWLSMAGTVSSGCMDASQRHDYYIYIEPYERQAHGQS